MERRFTSRIVCLDWIENSESEKSKISSSIQEKYEHLRLQYEADLRKNWVEQLESPNQVLEQLSLAACLIELWKSMCKTESENESQPIVPNFVDIACGNGILVYVLRMEGYEGSGYDASRRKSWSTFPPWIQSCLHEKVIIPKPFLDMLGPLEIDIGIESGLFPENTFIISDHADELTVWTPILAALANPCSPLPFMVVPCCSRSLAGSYFRYPPGGAGQGYGDSNPGLHGHSCNGISQPCSGDLRALRAAKMNEKTENGFLSSMAGSLAAKTASIAEEIDFGVEKAWLRTPGAVNMALIGGRNENSNRLKSGEPVTDEELTAARLKIMEVVERECLQDGGIQAAAQLWIDRLETLRHANQTQHQPY